MAMVSWPSWRAAAATKLATSRVVGATSSPSHSAIPSAPSRRTMVREPGAAGMPVSPQPPVRTAMRLPRRALTRAGHTSQCSGGASVLSVPLALGAGGGSLAAGRALAGFPLAPAASVTSTRLGRSCRSGTASSRPSVRRPSCGVVSRASSHNSTRCPSARGYGRASGAAEGVGWRPLAPGCLGGGCCILLHTHHRIPTPVPAQTCRISALLTRSSTTQYARQSPLRLGWRRGDPKRRGWRRGWMEHAGCGALSRPGSTLLRMISGGAEDVGDGLAEGCIIVLYSL